LPKHFSDPIIRAWLFFLVLAAPFFYSLSENLTLLFVQLGSLFMTLFLVHGMLFHEGGKLSTFFFRVCLVWLVCMGISTIFSIDPTTSLPFFLKVIGLVLVACSVRYALDSPSASETVFFSAGIAVIVQSAFGIFEYLMEYPIPPSWIDPGMRGIISSRAAGLFGDPNILAGYLSALLPYVLGGFFEYSSDFRLLAFWSLSLFLGIFAIMASFSRGGYVAGIVSLAVVLLLIKPNAEPTFKKKILGALALVLIGIFFIGPFKYRFFSIVKTSDMTLSQRTLLTKGILGAAGRVPLFGFGPHTFSQVYPQFRVVGGDYPLYAHNEILQSFFEMGVLTALALATCCFVLFRQIYLFFKQPKGKISWLTVSLCGSFAALVVQNFGGFTSRILPTSLLIALSTGGILNGMERRTLDEQPWFKARIPLLVWVVFIVLLVYLPLRNFYIQSLLSEAQQALRLGKALEAHCALKAVENLDPNIPITQFLLSQADEALGRIASATERLAEAIRLNPLEANFWLFRGRLALKYRFEQPNKFYEKAIELDPAAESFRLEYAQILASAGREIEAMKHLDTALKFSPGSQFHDVYPGFRKVEEFKKILSSRNR